MGSILCNFMLKHYPKDLKKKLEKVDDNEKHIEIKDKFESIFDLDDEKIINVSLSVFGLRNLMFDCYKPRI